jgi:hypothetical protein
MLFVPQLGNLTKQKKAETWLGQKLLAPELGCDAISTKTLIISPFPHPKMGLQK